MPIPSCGSYWSFRVEDAVLSAFVATGARAADLFLGWKGDSQAAWMSRTGGKLFDNHILNHSVGLVYADGPFTGPQIGVGWGEVGWGGVWYHSSVLQDMMWCYATHGVGWGGLWYHSSVLQDMMWCYATHGWGGVGCDIIRQYCKTWCDATLRMGWGGVGCDIIRSQVQGKRNGLLFKYIRSQQWRWEHTGFDLLTATGEAVRSLMRWREKATLFVRRVLQHKTL